MVLRVRKDLTNDGFLLCLHVSNGSNDEFNFYTCNSNPQRIEKSKEENEVVGREESASPEEKHNTLNEAVTGT